MTAKKKKTSQGLFAGPKDEAAVATPVEDPFRDLAKPLLTPVDVNHECDEGLEELSFARGIISHLVSELRDTCADTSETRGALLDLSVQLTEVEAAFQRMKYALPRTPTVPLDS
jgi:hypothetical protein